LKEEMSLGEKIFVFSDAGQRKIAKEDWQSIPAEDRAKGMIIYNELKQNGGIINLEDKKKISLIEKSHKKAKTEVEDKGITLEEKWNKLTEKEKLSFLKRSVNMQDDLKERLDQEKIDRLPGDVKTLVNLSQSDWDKLPKNCQELILRKMDFFEGRVKEIPDVKDFSKLSEKRKEAILRKLS